MFRTHDLLVDGICTEQGFSNIVTLDFAGLVDAIRVGAGATLTIEDLRFMGNVWLSSLSADQLKGRGSTPFNNGNCLWPGITIEAEGEVNQYI